MSTIDIQIMFPVKILKIEDDETLDTTTFYLQNANTGEDIKPMLSNTTLSSAIELMKDGKILFDGEENFLLNDLILWNYRKDSLKLLYPTQTGNSVFVPVRIAEVKSRLTRIQLGQKAVVDKEGEFRGIYIIENVN